MQISEEYRRALQGYHVQNAEKWSGGMILSAENETGTGTMRCCDVFPGAILVYNQFEMLCGYQKVERASGYLHINHCRRGCYELQMQEGSLCYIGEGDLTVSDPGVMTVAASRFPTGRYEGISVMLEVVPASGWLAKNAAWAGIDLYEMKEKMQSCRDALLLRSNSMIGHIFDELYHVEERVRQSYTTVKIIELLLFLSLAMDGKKESLPRFSPAVTEAVMQAHEYLSADPLTRLTVAEIAAKFHVAETSLRECFKAIYGQTVGGFLRSERIRGGARLLCEFPEMTIGEIALKSGYENPSKFAGAFKALMGMTPMAYRHRIEQDLQLRNQNDLTKRS